MSLLFTQISVQRNSSIVYVVAHVLPNASTSGSILNRLSLPLLTNLALPSKPAPFVALPCTTSCSASASEARRHKSARW